MTRLFPIRVLMLFVLQVGLASPRCSQAATTPIHRIGVRQTGGIAELYDTVTGTPFVARGNNYTRLGSEIDYSGNPLVYHVTFKVGSYDAARTEAALRKMGDDGYTVVRVLLDPLGNAGELTDPAHGVSTPYLTNVVDFLRRAAAHGLHVIITQDFLPNASRYNSLVGSQCCTSFANENLYYLTAGGLEGWQLYYADLVNRLASLGAPLEAILSYELRSELYFVATAAPLTLASGVVRTGNGLSYDMADPAQKQAMMDQNLVYWIDQLRQQIRRFDANALVSVGFFEPQGPNPSRPGDPRVIRTYPAIWQSSADFIDLHPYPGVQLTLPQYVENFEIGGYQAKPILMGEFGAFHFA